MLAIDTLTFPFADFTGCYSLTVQSGQMVGLVGPSGGGKTTLLDGIAGFLTPSAGSLTLDGKDQLPLPPSERPIAMIFQDFNLFPDLTVAQNIGLGIRPSLRLSASEEQSVADALTAVELPGYGDRKPASLSGGERQRVALARAMAGDSRLLLLDEAFSGLDPGLRKAMLRLVRRIQTERGMTALVSIHTPSDLPGVADGVAFIAGGQVRFTGAPEAFLAATHIEAIAEYLG